MCVSREKFSSRLLFKNHMTRVSWQLLLKLEWRIVLTWVLHNFLKCFFSVLCTKNDFMEFTYYIKWDLEKSTDWMGCRKALRFSDENSFVCESWCVHDVWVVVLNLLLIFQALVDESRKWIETRISWNDYDVD